MVEMGSKLVLITPEIMLFVGCGRGRGPRAGDVAFRPLGRPLDDHRLHRGLDRGDPGRLRQRGRGRAAGLLIPSMGLFLKTLVGVIAIGLVLIGIGMVDRRYEDAVRDGKVGFDPLRVVRGEYHAFMLLSLAGTMLIANANDLIWLFLAMELSSLPTYVMVALGRGTRRNMEAAIKYFFLGAMSSATFLYGFALLYGATGTVSLTGMQAAFAELAAGDGIPLFGILGMVLAIVGLCFKITAVPMHFYAPDVYQRPDPGHRVHLVRPEGRGLRRDHPALLRLGWQLALHDRRRGRQDAGRGPAAGRARDALGGRGAHDDPRERRSPLQKSVKRMLAYSSIANSGVMLVGVVAGTAGGIDAVMLFLATYGVATVAIFAALAALERQGREIDKLEDLGGLWKHHSGLATMLALGGFSLVGLPPLLGFWGKFDVVVASISAGETVLVVVLMAAAPAAPTTTSSWPAFLVVQKADARSEGVVAIKAPWPRSRPWCSASASCWS